MPNKWVNQILSDVKYGDILDKDRATRNYIAYMLDRTQRIFEYKGLPVTLSQRNFELILQRYGYAVIPKPEYFGGNIYAFGEGTGLGGQLDAYYMPTIATVASPYLKFSKELKIDDECIVIPNDSLYQGLIPLLSKYVTILVENDITIRNAIINDRALDIIDTPDDNARKAAEQYLKDVESGKMSFLAGKGFAERINVHSRSAQSNLLTQHIEIMQYIKASMLNDLGLNANYNMKRESLNDDEISLNDDALLPLVQDMLENRRKGIEKMNELYGTNISVDFSKLWKLKEESIESDGENTDESEAGENVETD